MLLYKALMEMFVNFLQMQQMLMMKDNKGGFINYG
jgi:hypothetical protein